MYQTRLRSVGRWFFLGVLGLVPLSPPRLAGEEAPDILQEVRRAIPPWQTLDEAWVAEAPLIFRATYRYNDSGNSWWNGLPRWDFTVTQVFKGDVPFKGVALQCYRWEGGRLPYFLVKDRDYLVFLKPNQKTRKQMAEKGMRWVPLTDNSEEVVAIVDLSQSKAEAEAIAVKATQSGVYDGFQFTPERWETLRASETIDLDTQRKLVPFLVNVVLTDQATLASVRSYLGEPDYYDVRPGRYDYFYHFQRNENAEDGQISGSLHVVFQGDLRRGYFRIEFRRCKITTGPDWKLVNWSELSEKDHQQLGLPLIRSKEATAGEDPPIKGGVSGPPTSAK